MFQPGCLHTLSMSENECPFRPSLLCLLVYYMKTWKINAGVKTKALGSCIMHELIHPDSVFFLLYISHSTDRCEGGVTELSFFFFFVRIIITDCVFVCVSETEAVCLTQSHTVWFNKQGIWFAIRHSQWQNIAGCLILNPAWVYMTLDIVVLGK